MLVEEIDTDSQKIILSSQNISVDSLDDDILDFSESNPFGDAGGT